MAWNVPPHAAHLSSTEWSPADYELEPEDLNIMFQEDLGEGVTVTSQIDLRRQLFPTPSVQERYQLDRFRQIPHDDWRPKIAHLIGHRAWRAWAAWHAWAPERPWSEIEEILKRIQPYPRQLQFAVLWELQRTDHRYPGRLLYSAMDCPAIIEALRLRSHRNCKLSSVIEATKAAKQAKARTKRRDSGVATVEQPRNDGPAVSDDRVVQPTQGRLASGHRPQQAPSPAERTQITGDGPSTSRASRRYFPVEREDIVNRSWRESPAQQTAPNRPAQLTSATVGGSSSQVPQLEENSNVVTGDGPSVPHYGRQDGYNLPRCFPVEREDIVNRSWREPIPQHSAPSNPPQRTPGVDGASSQTPQSRENWHVPAWEEKRDWRDRSKPQ